MIGPTARSAARAARLGDRSKSDAIESAPLGSRVRDDARAAAHRRERSLERRARLDVDDAQAARADDGAELREVLADERIRRRDGHERNAREKAAEHQERVIDRVAGERDDGAFSSLVHEMSRDALRGAQRVRVRDAPKAIVTPLDQEFAVGGARRGPPEEIPEPRRMLAERDG